MEQRNNTNTEALADRPTALTYDLAPGEQGYWPLIGGAVSDICVGDRISEAGDTHGEIVATVDRSLWPFRLRYTNTDGKARSVGSMAPVRVDRWTTSGNNLGGLVR